MTFLSLEIVGFYESPLSKEWKRLNIIPLIDKWSFGKYIIDVYQDKDVDVIVESERFAIGDRASGDMGQVHVVDDKKNVLDWSTTQLYSVSLNVKKPHLLKAKYITNVTTNSLAMDFKPQFSLEDRKIVLQGEKIEILFAIKDDSPCFMQFACDGKKFSVGIDMKAVSNRESQNTHNDFCGQQSSKKRLWQKVCVIQ